MGAPSYGPRRLLGGLCPGPDGGHRPCVRSAGLTPTVVGRSRGLISRNRPIARTLQDEALAANAGLLVMGAHGHSRLRDFVLGGATRGVLADLRVPLLASGEARHRKGAVLSLAMGRRVVCD
ncbi:MAG TPA: universal stress protein [Devosia sp.]|nr:universal stress protein [Devosia sp.]